MAGCASVPQRADLVITNATVYAGSDLVPVVATVGVRDGVFTMVDPTNRIAVRAGTSIDGTGLFLVPGLWDMHVHVRASEEREMDVAAFPRHGVTSVRDLGGYRDRIRALQGEIDAGRMVGPKIYSTYTTLNGEAFAPFQHALTREIDVAGEIDDLAGGGAVQIKIHRALPPAILPVVLDFAHQRKLAVTGHIPLGVHPLQACELGMDGIEHIGSLIEAYVSVTKGATSASAIDYLLSDASKPLYDCLVSRGVEVTPTLVVYRAVARARAKGETLPAAFTEFIDAMGRIALRLHQTGVTLLSGTDTSDLEATVILPGSSLIDELEMLQKAGIPAREVIKMATANAARTLGLAARTGSIEAGKAADFVLLAADPGADIANMRQPVAAYRAGRAMVPAATAVPKPH